MEEIKSMDKQDRQARDVNGSLKKEFGMGQKFFFTVLVILVAIGIYTAYRYFVPATNAPVISSPAPARSFFADTYYGVFLDNNDVYFGKIAKRDASFVTLENTFYLRVTQVSQKGKDGKQVDVPNLNLVKLGAELHKPKDKIELQVSHIVSIQELDQTSEVVKIITEYKVPAPVQAQ